MIIKYLFTYTGEAINEIVKNKTATIQETNCLYCILYAQQGEKRLNLAISNDH